MEHMPKEISELLQQIRQVENEHNQLVDEYFQIKDNVKQALTNLNNNPSSNHFNTYNYYSTISETLMKNIRLKRLALTNLICDLHKHGIFINDDENESDNDISSSLDEGIDENSLSLLDLSSKLSSSLNNSENNNEEIFDDII